jgi:hypothetical protein
VLTVLLVLLLAGTLTTVGLLPAEAVAALALAEPPTPSTPTARLTEPRAAPAMTTPRLGVRITHNPSVWDAASGGAFTQCRSAVTPAPEGTGRADNAGSRTGFAVAPKQDPDVVAQEPCGTPCRFMHIHAASPSVQGRLTSLTRLGGRNRLRRVTWFTKMRVVPP